VWSFSILDLMQRVFVVGVLSALLFSACGGGSLSLSEYSDEGAALFRRVDARLDAHAEQLLASPPDVAATQAFLDEMVVGYHELVDGIDVLEPPEEVAELHAALQEILASLLSAHEAWAAFAKTVLTIEELDQVWEGPEAQAVQAARLEAVDLCYAAQDHIDATRDREALEDVPWIPAELKEVVRVSFNCGE
jgi:hypothetical protein